MTVNTKFRISEKTHRSLTGLLAMNSCSPISSSSALDRLATGGARSGTIEGTGMPGMGGAELGICISPGGGPGCIIPPCIGGCV